MPDTDWPRVREWFDEAVARDGDERAAFLARLAVDQPTVAPAVCALVEALDREPDFLERGPGALAELGRSLERGEVDASGRRLGRYRIERVLGEGGMGVVYLAVHDEGGLRRPVALKIARAALATPALAERFVAERDILARLAHPNIAHLYDGGLTAEGRPYLVMEYVDGLPITAHCRARGLDLRARLALVRAVCGAVDFAHRHLVVHRDLKPGNVLVTADGQVKLLDFGVAKVLGDAPAAVGGAEPATLLALTPAYAAPEQFRRGRVTTAVDVYGLGAIAYELVSGRRPHALDGLSLAEAERVVCAEEPAAPVGGRRRTDLDHVLLKALRADPAERYATPGAFAEDLARVLDGRPVRARTPTLGYRAARFARRHRGRVALGALAALALLATTAAAVGQAREARAAARRAEAERAHAVAASARAQRINTFLQGVLATANPSWYVNSAEKGPKVTVLRALELAAERMDRELPDDPETRADIHHTLGDTYRVLGQSEAMRWHFARALAIRQQIFRPPHPKIADGLFYAAVGEMDTGRWDVGDSLGRAALVMQRQRDEGNNLPYLYELAAGWRLWAGDFRGADTLLVTGLAIARARYPAHHPLVYSLTAMRARALSALGSRDAAWQALAAMPRDTGWIAPVRARLAAADGDFRRADSLFEIGLIAARANRASSISTHLDRVHLVLIPARRWPEARRVLAAQAAPLAAVWRATPGMVTEVARAAALRATVSLGEGHPARAAYEARAALVLIDSALGGAHYDPFWEARVVARSALARAELARGNAAAARPVAAATLADLARRGVQGPMRVAALADLAATASAAERRGP